jgi:hypothetical protein
MCLFPGTSHNGSTWLIIALKLPAPIAVPGIAYAAVAMLLAPTKRMKLSSGKRLCRKAPQSMKGSTAIIAIQKTFTSYNMERNTVTTIVDLKEGDRFYKQNDKHKKVLVAISHKVKRTMWQTYHYWCIPASIYDRKPKQEVIERYATPVKGNTPVIFLRHTESPVI